MWEGGPERQGRVTIEFLRLEVRQTRAREHYVQHAYFDSSDLERERSRPPDVMMVVPALLLRIPFSFLAARWMWLL